MFLSAEVDIKHNVQSSKTQGVKGRTEQKKASRSFREFSGAKLLIFSIRSSRNLEPPGGTSVVDRQLHGNNYW